MSNKHQKKTNRGRKRQVEEGYQPLKKGYRPTNSVQNVVAPRGESGAVRPNTQSESNQSSSDSTGNNGSSDKKE